MLRRLLMWVIVALLPVQGYAAASMVSCGPMHAAMAAADDHGHGSHHHDTAASVPHDAGDEPSLALGEHKCSACAACCTAPAVPASAPLAFAAPRFHAEPIPFHPTSEGGIVPDGLERPPRALLA